MSTLPRRVRARFVMEPVGRIPSPQRIMLVERLRVSSTCANRPRILEWRLSYARTP